MANRNDIERLFKAHYSGMHRLATAIVHDEDLARDIVQDVFAALLDSPTGFTPGVSYLLKAVRNRGLNHVRDCGIHQRIAHRYFLEDEEYNTENWPDEETIGRIHGLIRSAIGSQSRRAMELRFTAGLPIAKVAATMGISETAVYRHLSHALKTIRQKLNENG